MPVQSHSRRMTALEKRIERMNRRMIDTLRTLQWISITLRGVPLSVKRN